MIEIFYPFLYIIFGLIPSLIWLFYYLAKDIHPEPKKMILKVFLLGVLVTIPVFFTQVILSEILEHFKIIGLFDGYPIIGDIIRWFIVIALSEEVLKYLVVKLEVFKSKEIDEPLDIMLYMVVVALGFAALENTLYLFSPIGNMTFSDVLQATIFISFIRFAGATFLHTLCSALVGYFMAIACIKGHHWARTTLIGIVLATLLHGLYDFSIMMLPRPFNFLIPIGIIIGLAVFIFYDFDEIKKVKGICKI